MRPGQERSREPAGPQRIGRLVSRLLARTGYDREQAADQLRAAWEQAVPETLAGHCRPGLVRRGVLDVFASHSAIVQELNFHKPCLLAALQEQLPAAGISDIRCRLSSAAAS
jgi:predicted nucleic acid-binding Zn ribbon protein